LFKVHLDILKIKIKNGPISFVFSGISFVFSMCFVPHENQHQIKRNFRNLLFIYMVIRPRVKNEKSQLGITAITFFGTILYGETELTAFLMFCGD
jgi:hypothetical protein